MKPILIVVVGIRGAGKSTLLQKLSMAGVVKLKPATTRPPRNPNDDEYEFFKKWPIDGVAWHIRIGQNSYGMRHDQLSRIERVGVTVFDPSSLTVLESFKACNTKFEILTVGLDTISDPSQQAERVFSDPSRLVRGDDFAFQLAEVRNCDVVLAGNAGVIHDAFVEVIDLLSGRGGLIAHRSIKALLMAGSLLSRARPESVQPASYDLRVGERAWYKGQVIQLSTENPVLTIEPYSFAWVVAKEMACLPRFIAAHFDLRIRFFLRGLILSNGPQVDPGYRGALLSLLFNGNDRNVQLKYEDHFATIEFVTTTCVTHGYSGSHQDQESFSHFLPTESFTSPGGTIRDDVNDLEVRLKTLEFSGKLSSGTFWAAISVFIALAVAVIPWIWNERGEVVKSLGETKAVNADVKAAASDARAAALEAKAAVSDVKGALLESQRQLEKLDESRKGSRRSLREKGSQ